MSQYRQVAMQICERHANDVHVTRVTLCNGCRQAGREGAGRVGAGRVGAGGSE